MPCRGPCGRTRDGGQRFTDYSTEPAACYLDAGHPGPHSWEPQYGADHARGIAIAEAAETGRVTMKQLLCSACRALARMNYDFDENPALSQWWDEHKKGDLKKCK